MLHYKFFTGSCICSCIMLIHFFVFFSPKKNASFGILISNFAHITSSFGKKPCSFDMSNKFSCLKLSLLTGTFLSVPFEVVTVGYKNSFHRFLHQLLACIAERWYFLKKGVVIKKFLC